MIRKALLTLALCLTLTTGRAQTQEVSQPAKVYFIILRGSRNMALTVFTSGLPAAPVIRPIVKLSFRLKQWPNCPMFSTGGRCRSTRKTMLAVSMDLPWNMCIML